jgi:hypothetical protein
VGAVGIGRRGVWPHLLLAGPGGRDASRAPALVWCQAGWPAASRRAVRREDASPGAVDAGSCGRGNGWDGGVGYVANAHEIGVVQLIRLS